MKAIVYERYGSPAVLQLRDVHEPEPAPNEIKIRIHAAEATKSDCELRSFRFPVHWFWLPLRIVFGLRTPRKQVLGGYFSGEVVAIGNAVTRFAVGDRIYGATRFRLGAYGEYLCLPESYTLALMPTNMDYTQAAAVPLGGLNAIHFMRLADIKPGDRVLINGAGASIGTFAVQIAKSMGAHVTAVDSGIKAEMLRSIGVDHFVDYTQQDFTKSGGTYDVIFSMVATTSLWSCLRLLPRGGCFLTANPRISIMLLAGLLARLTGKQIVFAFAAESIEELQALTKMIEDGQVCSVVDKVYPREQAPAAHQRVETEQRIGSVVLQIAAE